MVNLAFNMFVSNLLLVDDDLSRLIFSGGTDLDLRFVFSQSSFIILVGMFSFIVSRELGPELSGFDPILLPLMPSDSTNAITFLSISNSSTSNLVGNLSERNWYFSYFEVFKDFQRLLRNMW